MAPVLRRILVAVAAIPLLILSACADDTSSPMGVDDAAMDASTSDAGTSDAGGTDAGIGDTGMTDDDTGATDAGLTDAGASDTDPTDANTEDVMDAGIDAVGDAGDVGADAADDTSTEDASADTTEDAGEPTTVTLTGTISRSTNPSRGGDAIGDVFIALFDNEPILDRDQMPVAFLIVEGVDLSDGITTAPYRLEGITPRAEPYWISAFLDDNGNASVDDAGPDRGDLVMLERFVPPASRQVTLAEPGDVTYVIDLNNVLPF